MERKWSGQITVFLSLILVFVCGLLCSLLESARTAGARCYLQTAAYSAMDSMFSQYHRELWEKYRIFGLENLEQEDIAEEFSGFMQPYLEMENWYPFEAEDCQIRERKVLTEDSGEYFEKEIVDYMKYGIWTKEWSEESASQALEELTEARQVSELTRSMEVQTKEAWRLEKALEDLGQCFREQKKSQDCGVQFLAQEDGSGFCEEGDRLIKSLKEVPGLVENYEKQADALGEKLQGLRQQYAEKTPDFSEEVRASLEAELFEYEAYTDKDGERRRQIAGFPAEAEKRIALVEVVQTEAEEAEAYIEDWEPEEEDDELDTAEVWKPVQEHFDQYQSLTLPVQAGVKDKEKEGLLKKLRTMADRGVLSLVLPDGASVSNGLLTADSLPSHQAAFEERDGSLLKKALAAEYSQVFLRHFCDTGDMDGSSGEAIYELEYLLNGTDVDETNLAKTVEKLLMVREGLNLIHILGDSEKRSQAKALAAAVVGATGIMPLVSITAFLIMSVWAFGEAVADVKVLLEKGKVPVIKGREDWRLSLDGLLDFAGKGRLGELSETENGLNYQQYLTLLLMTCPGTQLLYRIMDVIQLNIARTQPGFQLADCTFRVDIQAEFCGKHVYFALGLLKSITGSDDVRYSETVRVSRQY
ncbi:MAG: DUF5702 domain-containing protein [Lachnospiraceae bacterium]|nr:DUF5702 domain-containing protein [Lachnospiraceae bacterium]